MLIDIDMVNIFFFLPECTNSCSPSTHLSLICLFCSSLHCSDCIYLFLYLLSISALPHVQLLENCNLWNHPHVRSFSDVVPSRVQTSKHRNFPGTRLNQPRLLRMLSVHRHFRLMDGDEKCPLETNRFGSAFSTDAYHRNRVNPPDGDCRSACHHWSSHYSAALMRLNREKSRSGASNGTLIQPGHRNRTNGKKWWTSLL